jgi:hypothetical protein
VVLMSAMRSSSKVAGHPPNFRLGNSLLCADQVRPLSTENPVA